MADNPRRDGMSEDNPQSDGNAPPDETRPFDESFYDFVDRIERGEWPIQIPFSIELGMKDGRPSVGVARVGSHDEPDAPKSPGRAILKGNYTLDQAKVRQIVLDQIAAAEKRGLSKLAGFALLSRVDRDCFFETAARHFVEALADGQDSLRDDPALTDFIVDLHERGVDLIVELVERTIAANRPAGERLRDVVVEAINESPCRDELGLLVVAELTQRFEAP